MASSRATGLFVTGFTVTEGLAIQKKAKDDLLAGRVVTSYSSQGTSVSKQTTLSIERVLAECRLALKTLDPDTYGRPRASRRVHANFGDQKTDL